MEKIRITAKEVTNKLGLTSLIYKEGRREVANIAYPAPAKYQDIPGILKGYRAGVNLTSASGFCWDTHDTIDTPKKTVEEYLNKVYYNKEVVIIYK